MLFSKAAVFLGVVCCVGAIKLEYDSFEPVAMKKCQNITLYLSFDETSEEEFSWPPEQLVTLTFDLIDEDSWAVEVLNNSLTFNYDQIRRRKRQQLTIRGAIIGVDALQVLGHVTTNATQPTMVDIDGSEMESYYLLPVSDPLGISTKEEEEEDEEEPEDEEDGSEEEEETEEEEEDLAQHVTLNPENRTLMREIPVSVLVKDKTLNNIFTLVMTVMIVVNTVNMGGQLDLKVIKAVFRKPIGPIVGFISQFLFMPLFSFGVGWLMTEDILFRLGLFVLGCCPGGTGSNFWCILLKGDINLSITMTFVSTVAALGMMPLWLFLLGRFLTSGDLVIPFGRLIMSLVFLIAPISLGMWIRYRWPNVAPYMTKIIVPFTFVTLIFIFTVGVYVNLFVFQLITGQMVAAGFMVAAAGYLLGAVLAWVFRLTVPQIKAVSIETAFQNGGIAFVLLKVSLPAPYGDLATVAPVAQLVITGAPLWLLLAIYRLYTGVYLRFCRKSAETLEPVGHEEKSEDEKKSLT